MINIPVLRRVTMTGAPPGHPSHGVVFQVLQEPTPDNPFLYIRREDTGELGFIEKDRIVSNSR